MNNNIKKRKLYFIWLSFFVLATNAYAGFFDDFDGLSLETFNAIHATCGLVLRVIIVYLPYLLFFIAPLGTYVYHKRKTDQEKEDTFKIVGYVIASFGLGFVGGLVVIYLLGMGLFPMHGGGDYAIEIFSQFNTTGVDGQAYDAQSATRTQNSLLAN